ncbi:PREDICTED: 23 kDa integral membrane protein-like [Polistes canadensis]|uniref:23 kDa integral membrane protein-like n=1 Tax=Polistes canadensis TaxID=91411 RepID=UPI000718E305|nr:PREDICTED: 23 kDa integral membrane protein-like [Polistes canadensis]
MARALNCLRYLLIVGTVVLGISGIVASTFAGFFLYQLAEYKQLTPDNVYGPSITLLVLGLFTCAVGWLSWHFLEFTQKSQVILFVTSLAIIGILETTAGIWALVRHEQIDFLPATRLRTVFVAKDNEQLWEHVQTKFQCCGMDGPTDYRGQNSVPWSCCDTLVSLKSNNDKSTCTSMYARGCHHVMISRARSILLHVFLLGLGGLLLKICLIICSACYVKAFTDRIERRRQDALTRRISSQVIYQPDNNSKLLNRQSSLNET